MLGDFNARVGSRQNDDNEEWHEKGPHVHGVLNDAGRELVSVVSINEAIMDNT